jgi:hypothetical protein
MAYMASGTCSACGCHTSGIDFAPDMCPKCRAADEAMAQCNGSEKWLRIAYGRDFAERAKKIRLRRDVFDSEIAAAVEWATNCVRCDRRTRV